MQLKKFISICLILVFALGYILPDQAAAYDFDPNFIISDSEYLAYDSLTLPGIQSFLEKKGSFLATFKTKDVDGKEKSAAEIIYRAANEYKISPKFLLVLLQKEQSLIETQNPTQYQLDWATGFARCDDPVACSPESVSAYQGFAIQVDRAAWRNRFYIENNEKSWLKKANITYSIDNYEITPLNLATANLYNYTPHYHGNYNFWKIWNRYFAKNYPDGTLLQIAGTDTIYLIEYGARRPFATKAAFNSRGYDKSTIIPITENDLFRYDLGTPIRFPNFTLVRSPQMVIYLLINEKKHKIVSPEVFKKLGFTEDEVVDLNEEEITGYPDEANITLESLYPMGALLRDKSNGGVFYVENGIKNPIWDKAILKSNFPDKKVIETTHEEIEKLTSGWPVKFKDGEILKGKGNPAVYIISNGERRPIVSGAVFEALGYQWKNVKEVDEKILNNLHPLGDMIDIGSPDLPELQDGSLVKAASNPCVYLIDNKKLLPIISAKIFESMGFKWEEIKCIPETLINSYTMGSPVDGNFMPSRSLAKAG